MTKKDRRIVAVVWLIGVILVWELAAFFLQNVIHDPMAAKKLPYFHTVIAVLAQNGQDMAGDAAVTFSRAAIGFALGALVGIILAILMSLSKIVEKIAFPYLIISQMIPVLGLAPIIFNIVRDMDVSRIFIAAYITFFPVSVNMLSGLRSVEQDKRELLYSIATNKFEVYRKLMIPASLPQLFTGLKITAPMAVTASILVDMLGSSSGIGVRILYALYSSMMDTFWAAVAISALMGIISYYVIVVLERFLIPWKQESVGEKAGDAA
ncbi:ABC transporter permease [Ethanoligenens harbinense]|nr:ABC transporter permease [Ethanoligenens harbinense YUAN-3]AYF40042.1 ABC transporter permease [Ethanoligenens harbinense]AYF42874.1 ABC transporter permease [Ethanoligenens harbinense]QCN93636.1 ABC transporter permease [Ethanoligenens harbinense]